MSTAIILDGNLKSALAAVRSLGERGIVLSVGATRTTAMACHSRYATNLFTYTSPAVNQTVFIDEIIAAAEAMSEKPVVFAFSDATYLTLYAYRDALSPHMRLRFPEEKAIEIAFDKAATYSEAKILGIPVIPTHLLENRDEVRRVASQFSYPAVVKTRHSIVWKDGIGVSGTATFVQDVAELESVFFEIKARTGESPLVQPYIGGEEYGVELLVNKGTVVAEAIHHRLRSMSPTGGASVLKETLYDSPLAVTMRGYARSIVQALGWDGPIMVEFKVDSDTREPRLMEVNGRWWGSLPLAVHAGVDFPYLYFDLLSGTELPAGVVAAAPDIVSRHFLGDVRHLLRVLFSRDPMRKYLYPKRTKAIKDFLFTRGVRSDVWSWRDSKPAVMEYIDALKR